MNELSDFQYFKGEALRYLDENIKLAERIQSLEKRLKECEDIMSNLDKCHKQEMADIYGYGVGAFKSPTDRYFEKHKETE